MNLITKESIETVSDDEESCVEPIICLNLVQKNLKKFNDQDFPRCG